MTINLTAASTTLSEIINSLNKEAEDFLKKVNTAYPGIAASKESYGKVVTNLNIKKFGFSHVEGSNLVFSATLEPNSSLIVYPELLKTIQWEDEFNPSVPNKILNPEPQLLVKHKRFSIVFVPTEDSFTSLPLTYNIELSEKDLSILPDVDPQKLCSLLLNYWLKYKTIPLIFDTSFKLEEISSKDELVKLDDGSLFYLQSNVIDNRAKFYKALIEGTEVPKNMIICIDTDRGILYQTDSDGLLKNFKFDYMSLTNEDFIKLFENSFEQLLYTNTNSAYKKWHYRFSTRDIFSGDIQDDLLKTPLIDLSQDKVFALATAIFDFYNLKYGSVQPSTFYTVIAPFKVIVQKSKDIIKIKTDLENKRKDFDSKTINDTPLIPNIKKITEFIPLQAESLAKLDIAEDNAILDVVTSGGKTVIIMCDILNLLNKGKIKRPLVVAPKNICVQFANQITYFTDGTVNPFIIYGDTERSWGTDELLEAALNAPKNTIFITNYDYLLKGKTIDAEGIINFPTSKWFMKVLKVDYVAIDESQTIKKPDIPTSKAVYKLRGAAYRRISTGTLIHNTPEDLIGQVNFLNNGMLGTRDDFNRKYSESQNKYGKVTEWKPDAVIQLKKDMRQGAYYLNYTEKDIAACLPESKITYDVVDFTQTQKKVYKAILSQIMEEIHSDPALEKAWQELINSNEEDNPGWKTLLDKFHKLEQFINAPSSHPLLKEEAFLSKEDMIPPKVKKIDERIEESIKAGKKVLVAFHHSVSAMQCYQNSKFKAVGAYYEAGCNQTLNDFATKAGNPQVIFAISESLKEGLNLQEFTDRIILGDIDWTPGSTKQLIARVWRIKGTAKAKHIVKINYVLCNESADVSKISRLISKKLNNAMLNDSPISPIPPLSINEEGDLMPEFSAIAQHIKLDQEYAEWMNGEIQKIRDDPNYHNVIPKLDKSIGEEKIIYPWVVNTIPPDNIEGRNLLAYIEQKSTPAKPLYEKDEIRGTYNIALARDLILDLKVFCENKYGVISRVGKSNMAKTVTIDFGNLKRNFDPNLVIVLTSEDGKVYDKDSTFEDIGIERDVDVKDTRKSASDLKIDLDTNDEEVSIDFDLDEIDDMDRTELLEVIDTYKIKVDINEKSLIKLKNNVKKAISGKQNAESIQTSPDEDIIDEKPGVSAKQIKKMSLKDLITLIQEEQLPINVRDKDVDTVRELVTEKLFPKPKKDISKIKFETIDSMSFDELTEFIDDFKLNIPDIDDLNLKKLKVRVKGFITDAKNIADIKKATEKERNNKGTKPTKTIDNVDPKSIDDMSIKELNSLIDTYSLDIEDLDDLSKNQLKATIKEIIIAERKKKKEAAKTPKVKKIDVSELSNLSMDELEDFIIDNKLVIKNQDDLNRKQLVDAIKKVVSTMTVDDSSEEIDESEVITEIDELTIDIVEEMNLSDLLKVVKTNKLDIDVKKLKTREKIAKAIISQYLSDDNTEEETVTITLDVIRKMETYEELAELINDIPDDLGHINPKKYKNDVKGLKYAILDVYEGGNDDADDSDEDETLDIELANLKNLPAIIIHKDDDKRLEDLDFMYHKPYVAIRLKSVAEAKDIFSKIEKKFDILPDNAIKEVVSNLKMSKVLKNKKGSDALEFLLSYKKNKNKKYSGTKLDAYCLCGDKVYIIFSKMNNPPEALSYFKKLGGKVIDNGFYFYIPKNGKIKSMSPVLNKLNKMYSFDKETLDDTIESLLED